MDRYEEIAHALTTVTDSIAEACRAAGRAPEEVTLLPVTKFHPASDIEILGRLGVAEVGENREQEARAKAAELPDMKFAMIGQIQSKKCNAVARWASSVHSVDSLKIADGLDRGVALALDRGERPEEKGVVPCFLQWSADGDASRGGVTTENLPALADRVLEAEHLSLAGLMCVPPVGADPAAIFAQAASLREELAVRAGRTLELSAGMSADMTEAIAAGSTIVRVGTAILGRRPLA